MSAGRHRAPQQRAEWSTRLWVIGVTAALLVGLWALLVLGDRVGATGAGPDTQRGKLPERSGTSSEDGTLSWGPTADELEQARALVAGWSPEQLAGQVLVGRFHGTDPSIAAAMVTELHLAGVSLQSENVTDAGQVRATTANVRAAVSADGREFPPVIGVDQEGGTVAHLDDIATGFPSYAEAGDAIAAADDNAENAAARGAVRDAAEAAGLELRDLGFTWVFAPVADVTVPGVDRTIGSRSASDDPQIAARAVASSVRGYNDAGIVSTVKHFVGHGRVAQDSHDALPELETSVEELRQSDLRPFRKAVAAGAPAIMMGHVALEAVDPGVAASLSAAAYELLAEETGFEGLVITDSLGMGAVSGTSRPAVNALLAGADLLLMPVDTPLAHRTLVEAINDGDLPRERIEDAAATVVAVQLWQQRVADDVPVPDDATERAEAASARLDELG